MGLLSSSCCFQDWARPPLLNCACYLYSSRGDFRGRSVSPPDRDLCGGVPGAQLWLGAVFPLQDSVSGVGALAVDSSRIRDSWLLPHPETASGPVLSTLRRGG